MYLTRKDRNVLQDVTADINHLSTRSCLASPKRPTTTPKTLNPPSRRYSWPSPKEMDWTRGRKTEMERQRGKPQAGLQTKLPAPIRSSSNPNYTRSHVRASSIAVDRLRQNFQKPEFELRTVSPTITPVTTLPDQSIHSPDPKGQFQVHRARLPPKRRVATTPTPNLVAISEVQAFPESRTTTSLGSPMGRKRYSLPPSRMLSPASSISPIMGTGTRHRRSQTTSEAFKVLDTSNADTPRQTDRTSKMLPRTNDQPISINSQRNSIRFVSTPVLPSEKKEASKIHHKL